MTRSKSAIQWLSALDTVLVGKTRHQETGRNKIASFDLDGTLIKTKSGKTFAHNEHDWCWWHNSIPQIMETLYHTGYRIVLFSNQNGLNTDIKIKSFKVKIEDIVNQINIPIIILAAMKKDKYRKPMIGMWEWLEENNDGVAIEKENSFYVGDAAGRQDGWKHKLKKDHSCVDRKFALNINLPFYTPEEYFLKEAKAPFEWDGFNAKEYEPPTLPTELTSNEQELIVCVGYPASGKTTFVKKYVPEEYVYVNQDTLKTREKCVAACKEALKKGKSVVVDNTNPETSTRQLYLSIARTLNIPARCFYFECDDKLALHNNFYRAIYKKERGVISSIAFRAFKSKLQEPTYKEGFKEIIRIPFVFNGPEEDYDKWRQWWN
ncbi:polynucleotide kinase 3 phosphatase-domain-containing protein [Pilobolus umbonatus]|nr:polynucleotide kinase 3 phosphatase-domain-containing protein [Pilobolus umbonatus]